MIEVRSAAESFARFIAGEVDVDVEELSFAEVVELTFAWHAEWQSSPARKAERENAKVAREAAAEARREARRVEAEERAAREIAAIEARLAKLRSA